MNGGALAWPPSPGLSMGPTPKLPVFLQAATLAKSPVEGASSPHNLAFGSPAHPVPTTGPVPDSAPLSSKPPTDPTSGQRKTYLVVTEQGLYGTKSSFGSIDRTGDILVAVFTRAKCELASEAFKYSLIGKFSFGKPTLKEAYATYVKQYYVKSFGMSVKTYNQEHLKKNYIS